MLRSRIAITVIGVIVIGSASAIGVLLTAAHGGPSIQPTALANTTATPTPGATASPTPAAASPKPTRPPSGEITDLHGIIANTSADNQFTYQDTTGNTWTIQVTPSTSYEGIAHQFSDLRKGMRAEISGRVTGAATFLAYKVNADD